MLNIYVALVCNFILLKFAVLSVSIRRTCPTGGAVHLGTANQQGVISHHLIDKQTDLVISRPPGLQRDRSDLLPSEEQRRRIITGRQRGPSGRQTESNGLTPEGPASPPVRVTRLWKAVQPSQDPEGVNHRLPAARRSSSPGASLPPPLRSLTRPEHSGNCGNASDSPGK